MMRLLIVLILSSLSACNTVSSTNRPANYINQEQSARVDGATASLFSSDSGVINDADIVKILNYQYKAPRTSRIAILNVSRLGWNHWSEAVSVESHDIELNLIDKLKGSDHVYDAAYLPAILVPEKRSVPFLREAAARFQADLLLIYQTQCRSFTRYRLLRSNQGRAYCTIESVLLDTRTGLVPFVATSTQNYDIAQGERDINYNESRIKSQIAATGVALDDIGTRLLPFIESHSDN